MPADLSLAERRLLAALDPDGSPCTVEEAMAAAGFREPVEVLRAAGGPQRHGLVQVDEETEVRYRLLEEGVRRRGEGLPERRAVQAIAAAGGRLGLAGLADRLGKQDASIAVGWLKRKGWARLEKGDGGPELVLEREDPPRGEDEEALAALGTGPGAPLPGVQALLGRGGLVEQVESTRRTLRLTEVGRRAAADLDPGEDASTEEVSQVGPELVARWAELDEDGRGRIHLRPFDLGIGVAPRIPGKPHPLVQLASQARRIFRDMGFQEIEGDYVESVHWNMDALFIPQDHPARDMQDTFYLERPATLPVDAGDLERARAVHEEGGGTGSRGWGGRYDAEAARRALLRTHTTNTTVRYLAKQFLGAEDPQPVHRVFGVGRVFRKETMDSTHLPEFTQIEGIATEPGASFDMLVGLCREFFTRLGFPGVRFRPAYFPYTEPSMEIEVLHGGRWMELGGCGVFRPEVTEPLGVKEPVLAWGLGLERLAMMRLGLKDIRQLYLPDLQWLRRAPLL